MKKHVPSTFERILYGVSAFVVLGVVGAAVWLDATPREPHPRVTVTADGEPWIDGELRAVPWVARNPGTWDVEQVVVAIDGGDGRPVEQEIDYLPRGTSRRGVALFPASAAGEPRFDVESYRLP